jgi:bifunctional DNA-binding transcriptional regulator/antitoxin component of YhaV-PrlF toxin-antitoxin module
MTTSTRRVRLAALLLPLLLTITAGCDLAMADFKQKETAEWRKTYEIQPGGRLEISNVNGKIDVEPSSGNTVEVVALKTAKGSSVDAARQALQRIEIREDISSTVVRLETKLQSGSAMFSGGGLEVHYTVRVPESIDIKMTTVNGGVELRGIKGKINAETTNGGIKATDISGAIEASTTNGAVEVELARVAEGGVKLECTNGGIKLQVPSDAKATISARITNGGIETNGLQIETTGESTRRRLDGRLNGGGPRLELEGTNGGIQISSRH